MRISARLDSFCQGEFVDGLVVILCNFILIMMLITVNCMFGFSEVQTGVCSWSSSFLGNVAGKEIFSMKLYMKC